MEFANQNTEIKLNDQNFLEKTFNTTRSKISGSESSKSINQMVSFFMVANYTAVMEETLTDC